MTLLLRCRGHTLPSDIEQRVNSYNRRMAGQPRTVSDHVISCDIIHVPLDNGVVSRCSNLVTAFLPRLVLSSRITAVMETKDYSNVTVHGAILVVAI